MRRPIAVLLAVAGALTATTSSQAADACSNAQFRTGAGASLPECRAWERVSPAAKNGVNVRADLLSQAAEDRVSFGTSAGLPEAEGSPYEPYYVASRGVDGWVTRAVDPPLTSRPESGLLIQTTTFGLSSDLFTAAVTSRRALTPGAAKGRNNVYVRDVDSGRLDFLFRPQNDDGSQPADDPGVVFGGPAGAPRLTFGSRDVLTPDALPDRGHLYSWQGGALRLDSLLPNGDQATNTFPTRSLVSKDGDRVTMALSDSDGPTALYQRVNGSETVLVSRSHRVGDDPGEPVETFNFFASPDGRQVVFSSPRRLTDATPAAAEGTRIYRWSADGDRLEDVLLEITDDPRINAEVQFVSPDGRYVWLNSFELRRPGAEADRFNLFVLDTQTGATSYVAPTTPGTKWSVGGNAALLASGQALTGPDSVRTNPNCYSSDAGAGVCDQFFVFDAANPAAGLACASCGASGSSTSGAPSLGGYSPNSRAIDDDGRVFFDSPDPLTTDDANTVADVYEFKRGRGLSLISSGLGSNPARLAGISPSGHDAFFYTDAPLVGGDADRLQDLYTARVDGGLVSQLPPAQSTPCSGDGCRNAAPAQPDRPAVGAPAARVAAVPTFSLAAPSTETRRAAARSGRLTVKVRVSAAGKVGLRARARVGGKVRTVATRSRTVKGASTVKLPLRLSAAARRKLRKGRSLRVLLSATFSPVSEPQTVRFTLKRTASRKKGGSR